MQDVLSEHADRAAVRPLEQVDAAKEGGLAGAGAPDQAHHLLLADGEVHTLEHFQISKALMDISDFHNRLFCCHRRHPF